MMFKTLSSLLSTFFFFAVIGLVLILTSFWKISQELPDFRQLAKYEPAVTTRLYAGDGQLMMEYATEKRLFVPEEKIPTIVKEAFIAAEDKNFYHHSGIDFFGIARAVIGNLKTSVPAAVLPVRRPLPSRWQKLFAFFRVVVCPQAQRSHFGHAY